MLKMLILNDFPNFPHFLALSYLKIFGIYLRCAQFLNFFDILHNWTVITTIFLCLSFEIVPKIKKHLIFLQLFACKKGVELVHLWVHNSSFFILVSEYLFIEFHMSAAISNESRNFFVHHNLQFVIIQYGIDFWHFFFSLYFLVESKLHIGYFVDLKFVFNIGLFCVMDTSQIN